LGKHFDELSKSLASGVSRRASLKRFATGTVGALLTNVLPSRGEQVAAAPVDEECREICRPFAPDRRARKRCIRECKECVKSGGNFVIMNQGPVCI
jgi:hypothetical protein